MVQIYDVLFSYPKTFVFEKSTLKILENRLVSFSPSPPHGVSHLVNAHLLPSHGTSGSGGGGFSLMGSNTLTSPAQDDLSTNGPSSSQQQQQQQQAAAAARAFLTVSSSTGLHLPGLPHSTSSATTSLLYAGGTNVIGGGGTVASGANNRVMNLSTEQDTHDYISANLPNLSPIRLDYCLRLCDGTY